AKCCRSIHVLLVVVALVMMLVSSLRLLPWARSLMCIFRCPLLGLGGRQKAPGGMPGAYGAVGCGKAGGAPSGGGPVPPPAPGGGPCACGNTDCTTVARNNCSCSFF